MALGDWLKDPNYIRDKAAADEAKLVYYNQIGGVPTIAGIAPLTPEQKAQAEAIAARSAPQGVNTDVRAAVQPGGSSLPPAYSPGFIPLPGPAPFVPYFQQAQPAPTPAPAPRPTSQFIYNQYRRPAPPRMMFEGLPSLLERFRMQPSAQQQYPTPPRFRFAEGGEAVSPGFGIKNMLRKIQETQSVDGVLPTPSPAPSAGMGIKDMIRRVQETQSPEAMIPQPVPASSPALSMKDMIRRIQETQSLEGVLPGSPPAAQAPAATPRPKMEDFLPQARFSFDASTSPVLPLQQVMYTQPTYRSYTPPRPNPVVMPQGSDALSMFLKNRRML